MQKDCVTPDPDLNHSCKSVCSNWILLFPALDRSVRNEMFKRCQHILDEYGITKLHTNYIIALSFNSLSHKSLCECLRIDKANTSRAIAHLRKAGYVTDNKESESSRKYDLSLTDEGRKIAKKLLKMSNDAFKQYFRGISDEEIALLDRCLMRIYKNIDSDGVTFDEIMRRRRQPSIEKED